MTHHKVRGRSSFWSPNTDIVREVPLYAAIFKKFVGIKLLHSKPALYGSADIINVCNLHC